MKPLLSLTLGGFALLTVCTLTACTVGPDYQRPAVETPASFKEAVNWKVATPADDINRGAWWERYHDATLNGFESSVSLTNQNVLAAEAAYRAAMALVDQSRAALFPSLSVSGGVKPTGSGAPRVANTTQHTANVTGSWDVDVWGGIRRTVEGDVAQAQASAATLAAAQLSTQALLATDYFDLRLQDSLQQLLNTIVADQAKALEITKNQYKVGVAAKSDVLSAQTELDSTKATAINTGILRAQLEHAIAVLLGKAPASFSIAVAPTPFTTALPDIPITLPATLLERRPDIANAERSMAAANAQIGVATAAFFPDVSLSASYGLTATALSKLFQASNSLWALGPTLAETVFDAGAREAKVRNAKASYDQAIATYRQTVLSAFQDTEDQLATLRILADQAKVEARVVESARQAEKLVLNQYKEGIVPYSSVITAQTARLTNEQAQLTVQQNRFNASIALIKALGGGWDTSQLTKPYTNGLKE